MQERVRKEREKEELVTFKLNNNMIIEKTTHQGGLVAAFIN